jgi:hypothetical protein
MRPDDVPAEDVFTFVETLLAVVSQDARATVDTAHDVLVREQGWNEERFEATLRRLKLVRVAVSEGGGR